MNVPDRQFLNGKTNPRGRIHIDDHTGLLADSVQRFDGCDQMSPVENWNRDNEKKHDSSIYIESTKQSISFSAPTHGPLINTGLYICQFGVTYSRYPEIIKWRLEAYMKDDCRDDWIRWEYIVLALVARAPCQKCLKQREDNPRLIHSS